jgi:hypothetical protein
MLRRSAFQNLILVVGFGLGQSVKGDLITARVNTEAQISLLIDLAMKLTVVQSLMDTNQTICAG